MSTYIRSWKDEQKTGVQCSAVVKTGHNAGKRCPFTPLNFDLCTHHERARLRLGLGKPQPIEDFRLENVEGLAHVAAANALSKCGLSVINQNGGWPDLLVKKANRLFAIEVKKGSDELRDNQRKVLNELSSFIPCFVLRLDASCRKGEITWTQLLEQLNVEPQLPEYFGA